MQPENTVLACDSCLAEVSRMEATVWVGPWPQTYCARCTKIHARHEETEHVHAVELRRSVEAALAAGLMPEQVNDAVEAALPNDAGEGS